MNILIDLFLLKYTNTNHAFYYIKENTHKSVFSNVSSHHKNKLIWNSLSQILLNREVTIKLKQTCKERRNSQVRKL